jgi:putative transposase
LGDETVRHCCDNVRAGFARRKPCVTRHLDKEFVTLRGEPYLIGQAVDQHGAELDRPGNSGGFLV